ncbi:MAG: NHL repeat-containing protein [Nitrososphaera sp.]
MPVRITGRLSAAFLLLVLLAISPAFSWRAASAATQDSSTTASLSICQPSVFSPYAIDQKVPLFAGICNPNDAVFDSQGNLWVADDLGRVLQFKPPFVNGENATIVIGQKDFTSLSSNVDESTLGAVQGVAFDKDGNLWVADQSNNRVLEFKQPFSNGMAASLVLGHSDFTTQAPTSNPTASSLSAPQGLTFDSNGNLWVADRGFFRVLEFRPPFSTGQAASTVIGADNFTWSTGQRTQTSLGSPVAVTFDSKGALWVTESTGRVLEFLPPFNNGEAASIVIGKRDFTQTFQSSPNFTFLQNPNSAAFDSSANLWVAATDSIYGFQPPFTNGQNASVSISCPVAKLPSGTCAAPVSSSSLVFDSHGNLWAAGHSQGTGVDLTQPCCVITLPPYSEGRVLEYSSVSVPEFPASSVGIVALASFAGAAIVLRRFYASSPSKGHA